MKNETNKTGSGAIELSTQQKLDQTTEALAEREARLRAILETAVESIITIDGRGTIESVNPAAEKLFGYKVAELMGKNVSVLMPSPHREQHDGYLANYARTGQARIIGIGREITAQRKDGTVFPADLSVSEVKLTSRRLFTGFIRDISERKRLEKEILEISDREQRRIGQDLHDGLCQQLAGIELMSRALEQRLAAKSKTDSVSAGEIAGHVRDAIGHTRLLARGLSPVTLESEGLMAALQELAANTEKIFHIGCRFKCDPPVPVEDHPVATHLFRIAQEAVSNAIRHGKATQVLIQLREELRGKIVLLVNDNGSGFPPTPPRQKGMGLQIMQSRAGMIGGTLAAANHPGGGASIVCSVAISGAAKHNAASRGRKKENH
jgi:two-component system, LuxR family, sensor kinase FixL